MQLNELLAQVDALKAEIDQLRPLKPDVEHRIMQKFRLDWNYHSNAIEGNSLTLGETRAFLMEGLTASGKPLKDHLDIKGHNELIDFLQLFIQRKERLTEAAIREMHKILLREPYEAEAVTLDGKIVKKLIKLGEYKATPNFVRTGTGEIHQYVSPEDVPSKMHELVEGLREQEEKADLHPVAQAALLHHQFLAIHPFDDGNGRLGRILLNLVLMRCGFPPVVFKLAARDQYIAALRVADSGEIARLAEFAGKCLVDAENLYLRGARGDDIEDADDIEKAVLLLKQELQNAPTPVDLSQDVQRLWIDENLRPLLRRLDQKLQQFDELFSSNFGSLHLEGTVDRQNRGNHFQTRRTDVVEELNKEVQKGMLLRKLDVHFHWEGFLKDGPNDFSVGVGFSIAFDKRKMLFECPNLRWNRRWIYSTWFSEDEQSEFVSGMAKAVLGQINQHLHRDKQPR